MIAKALLKREKSAHINTCAKTQLYFKSVQRQLRGESITYLLLQGWQLVTRITLSSVSCTCTIEVSLQQALGKKLTSKTIKFITQLQIHLHMDSCIPTPVPTHKQSCVSCSFAEHPGASWWAVYMRVVDPALLPLPARHQGEPTGGQRQVILRNSGGVIVYPAARWQPIKRCAHSTAEVKINERHSKDTFIKWCLKV